MKKRYYNATTKEWYTEGNNLTRRVNDALFSGIPSVEQLLEWGFEEIVETPYVPTEEELLQEAKQRKVAELMAYDSSDAVNTFIIRTEDGDITAWFDTEKRNNAFRAIDSAKKLGDESISFAIDDMPVTMTVATAEIYLARIEKYAVACVNITASHKAAINAISTIKAVEEYDYKTGYPEKLIFSL